MPGHWRVTGHAQAGPPQARQAELGRLTGRQAGDPQAPAGAGRVREVRWQRRPGCAWWAGSRGGDGPAGAGARQGRARVVVNLQELLRADELVQAKVGDLDHAAVEDLRPAGVLSAHTCARAQHPGPACTEYSALPALLRIAVRRRLSLRAHSPAADSCAHCTACRAAHAGASPSSTARHAGQPAGQQDGHVRQRSPGQGGPRHRQGGRCGAAGCAARAQRVHAVRLPSDAELPNTAPAL